MIKIVVILEGSKKWSSDRTAPSPAQDPGDLGVFFDAAGTQTTGSVVAGVPFTLYVVAFDTPGNILAFEGQLEVAPDPGLTISSMTFAGPTPYRIGTGLNWIVGAGGCVNSSGPLVLVTITMIPNSTLPDVLFSVVAATPSSIPTLTPGWLDCADEIYPFGEALNGGGSYPDGCAVGNPTGQAPVATESADWGGVKALYR